MVYKFSDKHCTKVALSGGKGASLAFLIQNGIPVPQGYVVSTEVFKKVIESNYDFLKTAAKIKKIVIEDIIGIRNLSKEFEKIIQNIIIPKDIENTVNAIFDDLNLTLVAVRSSATSEDSKSDSWAGELETYLNIDKEKLFVALKKCWSSLFSERALTYRIEKKLVEKNVNVAVVIQEMVQSDVSGVAFCRHPVSGRKNIMLIEAVYGLGEAIVSGEVTPDTYLIDKDTLTVLRTVVRKQDKMLVLPKNMKGTEWIKVPTNKGQKIDYKQIQQLADICRRLEVIYTYPQDIEWSFKNNSFFIIQSRPITTL